jgi:DNA-directed RNA polymerase omega subunit
MARVTVEDCLERVPNRFALTILAARRARMLGEGRGSAMVDCDNKEGVTALREIGDSHVRFKEDVDEALSQFIEEQRRQLRVTTMEHSYLETVSLRAFDEDADEGEGEADDEALEELPADPERLRDPDLEREVVVEEDDAGTAEVEEETPPAEEEFSDDAEFGDEEISDEIAGEIEGDVEEEVEEEAEEEEGA